MVGESRRSIIEFPELIYDSYKNLGWPILFDEHKFNWEPSCSELETYVRDLCNQVVLKFKELERTQEYKYSRDVLFARVSKGEYFINTGGEGVTTSEISCTHCIDWGLGDLLRNYKETPKPFELGFIVIGKIDYDFGDKDINPMPLSKSLSFVR